MFFNLEGIVVGDNGTLKDAVCLEGGLARWCWAVANDIGPRNFSRDCNRNIHSASATSSLASRAQGR
jgi:hypothetical protein